jgi:L-ascorbate metabolism protein UlaG (beta-lactamase superfamily)
MTTIEQIESATCVEPTLWWLGGCGFVVKYYSIVFYIDPPAMDSMKVNHADMVLRTSVVEGQEQATAAILAGSPRAKVIVPKSAAQALDASGIGFDRMTTTDAGLRVEYFKGGVYGRVYSVPSSLEWTPLGGYPKLGYLIRFGGCTIYHAGGCGPYAELAEKLKPYNVSVALLPIGAGRYTVDAAAQLAEDIQARWLVPADCDGELLELFTTHMLGQRPEQKFKVFKTGECWTVPAG